MNMPHFWIILVIFGFHGIVFCKRLTPSTSRVNSVSLDENVRECYEDMKKDSDISHLLLDVTSPERIDYFCGRTSRLKKCIADFEHQLSNEENTEYLKKTRGISAFYLNVCPPGTDITQKYKGNAPCFQLIKNQILSCGSDLPDMSSYEMQNDLDRRCCALSRHRKCVTSAAADHCGKEAGEVVNEILFRYFQTHLEGCWDKQECLDEVSDDSWTTDDSSRRRSEGKVTVPKRQKYYTTPTYDSKDDGFNSNSVDALNSLTAIVFSVTIVLFQFVLSK
ncbi:uncharacterized protein NPIL_300131 [Nephila pilipes]|uniref:Uncharacterized protein n=1 Tax=Nephila pilipes TaxID=299642 RepID=A0A8X6PV44_NEPPI|nr:uncharacterized protein NPIL_300131 [Nephila pilipes]